MGPDWGWYRSVYRADRSTRATRTHILQSSCRSTRATRTHILYTNSTEGWHRNGISQRLLFSVAFVSDLWNRDAFNWRSENIAPLQWRRENNLVNSSGIVYNLPFLVRLLPQSLHTIIMPLTNQHWSLCSEYLTSRFVPRSYRSSIDYCSYVLYPWLATIVSWQLKLLVCIWQLFAFMLKKKNNKSTHSQQLLDTAFARCEVSAK